MSRLPGLRCLIITVLCGSPALLRAEAVPFAVSSDALEDQAYTVAGLSSPARIQIDRWGVPHIYAQSHYDAFFVQGFNAARDRLWQIDLWRRRGLGQLSEVLGERYLAQDEAARLFLYRGDMYREWLAYGSDAKRIASAFVAGINAYIELIDEQPDLLPVEFALLGYRPARWAAADVVRIRSHGLWRNVASEVRRARIICELGMPATRVWKVLEPRWTTQVPVGLNPCSIPDGVLDQYLLAKAPVRFDDAAGIAASLPAAHSAEAQYGSNNWAVAPSRTKTGRPILADDPHRAHAVPSLRYIAHLKAPGLNVIGAGEPGLPGISIGHNERIAFGLTIFPIDQEDLYVYSKNRGGYFYDGRAEPLRTVTESVAVRDGDPREVKLRFTRHGPVVFETDKLLFAVRAAWLDAGMAPYFGGIEYMRADNWREFRESLNRWGAPSENQVYADIDGNIGYKPAGLFPKRQGFDGLLPVPGDGRYEWNGYFDMDVLPVEFNPERGYVSTANALSLPADYPIDRYPVGFEWSPPWRHLRIRQVLGSQDAHRLTDSQALQHDYRSLLAVRLLAALKRSYADTDSPAPWRSLLAQWDGTLSVDSAAAAFYAVWLYQHFEPMVAAHLGGEQAALLSPLDPYTLIAAAEDAELGALIGQSLSAAWTAVSDRLGADSAQWRWGDLHTIEFEHPLARQFSGRQSQLSLPAHPRGGSGNSTNNTIFDPEDLKVRAGASFRMVLDVGRWDAATASNAPGQSGDPRSPFYQNLLAPWATDQQFPLLYSDAAVEGATVQTIELSPEPGNTDP